MSEALYIEMPLHPGRPAPTVGCASFQLWAFFVIARTAGVLLVAGPGACVSEAGHAGRHGACGRTGIFRPCRGFYVRKGDRVRRERPLLRMNARAYRADSEAGRESRGLAWHGRAAHHGRNRRQTEAAQDAEQDMVRRLAQARNEEDVQQQLRQERGHAHAAAIASALH